MIPRHVEQGPEADSSAEQVGALGDGGADQEAGIRAAADGDTAACRAPFPYKPLRGGNKVIKRVLPVLALARSVPLFTEL